MHWPLAYTPNYKHSKDMSNPKGLLIYKDKFICGERCVFVTEDNGKRVIYTKGSKMSVTRSFCNCVIAGKRVNQIFAMPGINYKIWYHLTIDVLFALYRQSIEGQLRNVVLPSSLQDSPILELVKSMGYKIFFCSKKMAIYAKEAHTYGFKKGRAIEYFERNTEAQNEFQDYIKYIRDYFGVTPIHSNRKIFAARKSTESRYSEAINRIEERFQDSGYDLVYFQDMTFKEQVTLASGVSKIAGFHGSNLTNAVYAPPRQKLKNCAYQIKSGPNRERGLTIILNSWLTRLI